MAVCLVTKPRICLVAPYPELAELANQVKKEMKLNIDIRRGALHDGVAQARLAREEGVQIIISRGGTVTAIKKKLDIPVVEMTITGYDVLRAIGKYRCMLEPIGIVGYENVVQSCRMVCGILGIPTHEVVISGMQVEWLSVQEKIQCLIDKHKIKTIVGDNVAVNRLKLVVDHVHMITTGKEGILQAVREANNILAVQDEEKKTVERFKTILNFVHDGIIVANEQGLIEVVNPVAEKIFSIKNEGSVNKPIAKVISNTRIDKVLGTGLAEIEQLQETSRGHILTSRIPIVVEGKVKGLVATFQEVSKIQERERKIRQNLYAKGLYAKYNFKDIISEDSRMQRLIAVAKDYAQTDATVLIQGENGTGKEIFAQSIHEASKRARGPFVALNCSALPPQLLESELFGYEEGAFTGAKKGGKIGLFELAHNGTIFLDEIGDVSKDVQTSMLRVLEDRKVMRLGSDSLIPVDVRIIAATNVDLKKQIEQKIFRMDLFYRLNVLGLTILPLRERKVDIPILAKHFIGEFGNKYSCQIENLPERILKLLLRHNWPGNIRELRNFMERLVITARNGELVLGEAELMLQELPQDNEKNQEVAILTTGTLREIKQRVIRLVLQEEQNKSRAAKRLGVDRGTIERLQ